MSRRRSAHATPRRPDEIGVIEAAYRTGGTDVEWLAGLTEVAAPLLDRGMGLAAFTAEINGPALKILDISSIGGPQGLSNAIVAFTEGADPASMAKAFQAGPCSTIAAGYGGSARLRADPASEALFEIGVNDAVGILGADGTRFVTGFSAFVDREIKLTRAFTARWGRIASHLAAGARCRRPGAEHRSAVGGGGDPDFVGRDGSWRRPGAGRARPSGPGRGRHRSRPLAIAAG
jgi:hypothetical protein